ncbi:MAG TPA: hypothetical protein VFB84_10330 [Micromonosporaceae bacterium]|nr:hypothetical protein [Micromonosporaceae bacterium]
MRRSLLLGAVALLAAAVAAPSPVQAQPADADDRVTPATAYVRHDGGTDRAVQHCSDTSTSLAPDVPNDGDTDSNDGGAFRQGNEPSVAIDPTNPNLVFAAWNDYCDADLGGGWMGIAFSRNRGETWTPSKIPGYPSDTSAEGMASPLHGRQAEAGDPLLTFDRAGNLFAGGIAFNRVNPQNGDVWVATYANRPHPSGYPKDYLRTVVVARGVPALAGPFQDKPELEADRTGGRYDGNVYICWSRFVGAGRTKIQFARSTDSGATFSHPVNLSEGVDVQGCDIAVEADGDVYVTWGTRNSPSRIDVEGLAIARSSDGGASFEKPRQVKAFTRYFPSDGARDCGDGAATCPSRFVFFRVPLEPRVTSDQSGMLPGIYATYNAVDPATVVRSQTTYSSAGANSGFVGRSVVYVVRSTDNGRTWSNPIPVDPAGGRGHQYFSDVDALGGKLVAMWQDNRTDNAYSVQLPIGNALDAQGRPVSSGTDAVGTYAAVSDNGTTFTPLGEVSSVTHQPSYEMFGGRNLPFQGDYNHVALAFDSATTLFGYMAWTDNRDVLPGVDIRETDYVDGFDVNQCRTPTALEPDRCPNAHGLDQNIYGQSIALTVG